jgi:hypothetical protein
VYAVLPLAFLRSSKGSKLSWPNPSIGSFSKRGKMLKIQRSSNGQVVFTISGQMDEENIAEMEMLLRSEISDRRIVLDLKDLTLAGREAIRFLGRCEAGGITLQNCAVYVREWITRERRGS